MTPNNTPHVSSPVLSVAGLSVSFPGSTPTQRIAAVGDATWRVHPGETLAIVGESGSGKSVTALATMGLLPPGGRIESGTIALKAGGRTWDLCSASQSELRQVRGRNIAMIFQEPMTSLNPVLSIGEQIQEVLRLQRPDVKGSERDAAADALASVRIDDPARRLQQYPHELSGGMRQRVMIAMAVACHPAVLLADEPTTALDVTVQARILDLLSELRSIRGMGVVLITHDLGVVADHADTTCVMFGGRVVEMGPTAQVLRNPLHPYTRALLECRPRADRRVPRLATVGELIGSGQTQPVELKGERFWPWWPFAEPAPGCGPDDAPELVEVGSERKVAIWRSK
jgi:peptide/nickel transport system ATP-binding protein